MYKKIQVNLCAVYLSTLKILQKPEMIEDHINFIFDSTRTEETMENESVFRFVVSNMIYGIASKYELIDENNNVMTKKSLFYSDLLVIMEQINFLVRMNDKNLTERIIEDVVKLAKVKYDKKKLLELVLFPMKKFDETLENIRELMMRGQKI